MYCSGIRCFLADLGGRPLGVLLVTGESGGLHPLPRPVMAVLNFVINILRSIPFLILMIMVIPLSRLVLGTSVGTNAAIIPLVVAAFPFVARLVEGSLRETDQGVLEAAQSMGCSTMQIVCKVLIPESLPALIIGFATVFITILSYGAMSGTIGGGGLGALAINYGYQRGMRFILYVTVVLLVVLVQIFQTIGTKLALKLDRRIAQRKGRK